MFEDLGSGTWRLHARPGHVRHCWVGPAGLHEVDSSIRPDDAGQ